MTKILENKLLLGFVVFSVCAIGFLSFANAETEPDFSEAESECDIVSQTTVTSEGNYTSHKMICEWEVNDFTRAGAIQEDLTDEEKEVLEKAKDREELPPVDNSWVNLPQFEEANFPDVQKNRAEKLRDIFCNKENPSSTDMEKCNYYSNWSFCEGGLKANSPIKKYEYWIVSEYEPSDFIQIDLQENEDGFAFDLKDYEWCRAELAQQIFNSKTHYQTLAKQIEKGEYNPYHADFAIADEVYSFSHFKADRNEIRTQEYRANNDFICNNSFYNEKFKKQQGCEITYDGTYKNSTSMTNFEKRLLNSDPMTQYFLYKEAEREGTVYYPPGIDQRGVKIFGVGDHTNFFESGKNKTTTFVIPGE